jgi:hypothetical protein
MKEKNPFKMWQAYLGALISVLAPPIINSEGFSNLSNLQNYSLGLFISLIIGFLSGWGLTILYRRLK